MLKSNPRQRPIRRILTLRFKKIVNQVLKLHLFVFIKRKVSKKMLIIIRANKNTNSWYGMVA